MKNRNADDGRTMPTSSPPEVAVIVPCFNEELTVGSVVRDLRAALPSATVYVYDNNSSDATAAVALAAGAVVRSERTPGKGNVVRRAFADIEADVYLMIDGDDTYDAAAAPLLVEALLHGPHDMVVGTRVPEEDDAYRPGHELGNRAFNVLVSTVFGSTVSDMLSGYRAFSRRFAKTFPAASTRFAIETELTVHAINHRMPVVEVPVGFRDRPEGSESKLSTITDGIDILRTIVTLLHHERPLWLYPGITAVLVTAGVALGGVVGTFSTAAAFALMLAAMLLQTAGRGRREQLRSAYLGIPASVAPALPAAPAGLPAADHDSTVSGSLVAEPLAAESLAEAQERVVLAADTIAEIAAQEDDRDAAASEPVGEPRTERLDHRTERRRERRHGIEVLLEHRAARVGAHGADAWSDAGFDPRADELVHHGDSRVIPLRHRERESVPPAAGEA